MDACKRAILININVCCPTHRHKQRKMYLFEKFKYLKEKRPYSFNIASASCLTNLYFHHILCTTDFFLLLNYGSYSFFMLSPWSLNL